MSSFFQNAVLPLLCGFFLVAEGPKPANKPFPVLKSAAAQEAIHEGLKAIGSTLLDVPSDPAKLKQLGGELSKHFDKVPSTEQLKAKLLLMIGEREEKAAKFQISDPDKAKLEREGTKPNPVLKHVQEQTWPASLTHGEKVALQAYTKQAYTELNEGLRTKGTVPAEFEKVHVRLQSAFQKARPFSPPIKVVRGMNLQGEPLKDFLGLAAAAHRLNCSMRISGYISTAVGDEVDGAFKGNVELRIKAVHGLDALPVTPFPSEREFLLNHNTFFKVTGFKKAGNNYIIECEQQPPG